MRPITITQNPANQSSTIVAASQSPGSGAITLAAGASAIDSAVGGRIIGLTSGGNDSGLTFTVTGIDQNGLSVTEAITGSNGGTAVSTKFYKSISSITHTGSVAGTLTVGTVNTTLSTMSSVVVLNFYSRIPAQVMVEITGTINYTVQETFDPILSGNPTASAAIFQSIANLNAKTSNANSQVDAGATGLEIQINSYTNGATLKAQIVTPSNSNLG